MKLNPHVEHFNNAMRIDPNAIFISLNNDKDKLSVCVINNITDEVKEYDAPLGPNNIFYAVAKDVVQKNVNNDFNNLSNKIRNQIKTFYYLLTNTVGQAEFSFTRV